MRLGLTGSDAYLEQWHWGEADERPGTPEELLDTVEQELDAAFDARRGGRGSSKRSERVERDPQASPSDTASGRRNAIVRLRYSVTAPHFCAPESTITAL